MKCPKCKREMHREPISVSIMNSKPDGFIHVCQNKANASSLA